MEHKFFNYKYFIANQLSSFPLFYSKMQIASTGLKDWHTAKDTDILIDGFPRSANTYATTAFIVVQQEKLKVANHIHKKSQFLLADKYNIPAILLIRYPADCISSLLIRQPKYDAELLFKSYYFLYSGLKHLNSFVIANFEDVLNDYGVIINKVNKKFGSNFTVYIKNAENEEKVKQIVQSQKELFHADDYNQRVAYPNREKHALIACVKQKLQQKKYERLYKKCEELYFEMVNKN